MVDESVSDGEPRAAVADASAGADEVRPRHGGATEPQVPRRLDTPWRKLIRALSPRPTRAQALAGLLCALVGFALVVQVSQAQSDGLANLRQSDLVRLLDEVTQRGDALTQEQSDLKQQVDQLQTGSSSSQAAITAAREAATTEGILAGRLPAEGPGVRVTITGTVTAAGMLNVLEELRNAGAEVIQVNDERIVVSSSFSDRDGSVILDGTELVEPYRWLAIGDADTLQPALEVPGGATAALRNAGATVKITALEKVEISAVRIPQLPQHAETAPSGGS